MKYSYFSEPQGEALSLWFRHVPIPIIHSKEMCFARRILRYYHIFQLLHLFWKFFIWSMQVSTNWKTIFLSLNRFFRMGNYIRFISITASEASYLQYCIIEPYVSEVMAYQFRPKPQFWIFESWDICWLNLSFWTALLNIYSSTWNMM